MRIARSLLRRAELLDKYPTERFTFQVCRNG